MSHNRGPPYSIVRGFPSCTGLYRDCGSSSTLVLDSKIWYSSSLHSGPRKTVRFRSLPEATWASRNQAPENNASCLVKRLHWQLKAALLCHNDSWVNALPVVLLAIRSARNEAINTKPAELVYGESFRLPGEFLVPSFHTLTAPELVHNFRDYFWNLCPEPTSSHEKHSIFCLRYNNSSSHVFVRKDKVRASFSTMYKGPFKFVGRHDTYITVFFGSKNDPTSSLYFKGCRTTTTVPFAKSISKCFKLAKSNFPLNTFLFLCTKYRYKWPHLILLKPFS